MPHIAITMYPGRDRQTKQALAEKMAALIVEELHCDPQVVSVSVEDIPAAQWAEHTGKFPAESVFVRAGK